MTAASPAPSTLPKGSISAVLIVKNEERKLAACLKTLTWADEIVVLDGGSEDRSQAIAEAAGARVAVRTEWTGFGDQRRHAEELARGDWIFMIDADERVTPELEASIRQAVTQGPAIYQVNRLCWCFGRFIRHSGMHPDWVPRLYPRGRARFDSTRVHERLRNPHRLRQRRLEGVLLHYVYDSPSHQIRKSAHYAREWARERAERGRKGSLAAAFVHGGFCFVRMYLLRAGFLDGRAGLLLAILLAQATFAKYAELWALGRQLQSEDAFDHER